MPDTGKSGSSGRCVEGGCCFCIILGSTSGVLKQSGCSQQDVMQRDAVASPSRVRKVYCLLIDKSRVKNTLGRLSFNFQYMFSRNQIAVPSLSMLGSGSSLSSALSRLSHGEGECYPDYLIFAVLAGCEDWTGSRGRTRNICLAAFWVPRLHDRLSRRYRKLVVRPQTSMLSALACVVWLTILPSMFRLIVVRRYCTAVGSFLDASSRMLHHRHPPRFRVVLAQAP